MKNPVTIEHAKLQVESLQGAVEFYTDVLGLIEIGRDDGVVYLGCGRDENFDLALEQGGTGLDHVAFRVDSDETLEGYAEALADGDVAVERTDGHEPGQPRGVRISLPSGVQLELVTVADPSYQHANDVPFPSRSAAAPLDFDHINIRTPSIVDDARFLQEHVGMKISEIIGTEDSWERAFVRCNEEHHDIAMGPLSTDGDRTVASLHHIAWKYNGVDHLVRAIDRISQAGYEIEHGLGRHYAGDNIYAYLWSPGGNRNELTAEMAHVYTDETQYLSTDMNAGVAWGKNPPESFSETSGLAGYEG